MKNKNLLSLLETTAGLQEQGEGAEFENLGQELAVKIRGGQAADSIGDVDGLLYGSCPVTNNQSCGKG